MPAGMVASTTTRSRTRWRVGRDVADRLVEHCSAYAWRHVEPQSLKSQTSGEWKRGGPCLYAYRGGRAVALWTLDRSLVLRSALERRVPRYLHLQQWRFSFCFLMTGTCLSVHDHTHTQKLGPPPVYLMKSGVQIRRVPACTPCTGAYLLCDCKSETEIDR